jgi:hypothetical protein
VGMQQAAANLEGKRRNAAGTAADRQDSSQQEGQVRRMTPELEAGTADEDCIG